MDSLYFWIIAADVMESIKVLSVIALILIVCTACLHVVYTMTEEKRFPVAKYVIAITICSLLSLLPSKSAMYTVLTINSSKGLIETDTGKKVLDLANKTLDDMLKNK